MSFSYEYLLHQKSTRLKNACVLAGPFYNIVDHSAPIASILDIPLITFDELILFKFKKFYPGLKCELREWSLPYLIEKYSTIFYGFNVSDYSFKELMKKGKAQDPQNPIWELPLKLIYHLHGCSDKHWFRGEGHLLDVDQVLLYGHRMKDLFENMNLLKRLQSYHLIGNYRLAYYRQHQSFYDELVEKEVFSKFETKQPTLLYAPTWMDAKKNCSIFKACKDVLGRLPDQYNLLIKLHPHLNFQFDSHDPKKLYELLDPYAKKKNIQILPFFPPVYPILNRVDAYIGDYSSVGYDALAFKLPMFFINHHNLDPQQDPTAFLLKCGVSLLPNQLKRLYPIIEKSMSKTSPEDQRLKQETYEYAFGKEASFAEIKKRLQSLVV